MEQREDPFSPQFNDLCLVKKQEAPATDSQSNEGIDKERSPILGLTFKFQTFDEFCRGMEENGDENFESHALKEIKDADSEIVAQKNPTEETSLSGGYFCSDTDSESLCSSDEFSIKSHSIDSNSHNDVSSEEETWSNSSEDCKNPDMQISSTDFDETSGLEKLWEHQEFLEQLKMELKKMRATGLATIMEESEECPNMDDLKPLKIDHKFRHGNPMNELFKFYKSYREKMRKFDIINYQKMYATGFLKHKDPLQTIPYPKSPKTSPILRIIPKNLNFRHRGIKCDPTKKFFEDLYGDLETTYVGQMCLSWEFLHWQYEKALEMWESDPRGTHTYNIVAGEFQQFQVLTERFIENEAFQGPRVQNYAKTRCAHRNLLQVPVIREDGYKRVRKQTRGDNEITCDVLIEILEESIRIFWRFVRADKDTQNMKNTEPRDSCDSNLLMGIRKDLQKKEKKLKEILRGGNCLLKRVRRYVEDGDSDQVLYFFSQVDLKLVSRVLNMSKMSPDQLSWCCGKLNNINFVNRKIHIDPSFLLFPCS